MHDIWPFAAWCYRSYLDSKRLLSLCLFSLAFKCCNHQVGEQWSSGHQNVLGSVSKIFIIHLPTIPFTFIFRRGNSFVLVLDSCDLVLLWQKDSSLMSDCSFKEGSLEMSEAKFECLKNRAKPEEKMVLGAPIEKEAWKLDWNEEEKLLLPKSPGQFPYCYSFLHTCKSFAKAR